MALPRAGEAKSEEGLRCAGEPWHGVGGPMVEVVVLAESPPTAVERKPPLYRVGD
jgi:hypothetical protein